MCGICGIVYFDGKTVEKNRIQAMTEALVHRGPDDEGTYFSEAQSPMSKIKVGFGFRRLSIIDVAGGHQPMRVREKVVVFNGEIYNYQELKKECASSGDRFKTESDTEVLLHLYDEFGEACLEKLNGMFAFALWNEKENELFLARDRLGIKPLYYFYDSDQSKFVFASEIKSLLRSGEVPFEFDPTGVMDFFTYRFVPAPYTILKNVRKVLPGHFIRIKNNRLSESAYWKLRLDELPAQERTPEAMENDLLKILEQSVRSQMVSDVPLGAFLSGGVDSSLIAALMAKISRNKIQTFSIGFEKGTGVDESCHARKVARWLHTEHYELIFKEKDLAEAEKIFSFMNEPVADPTILPTAVLSRFARKEVKVVLTGEGGDELFAGYNRYKAILYSEWVKNLPKIFQPAAQLLFRRSGNGDCFKAIPDIHIENWFLLNRDFVPEVLQPFFRLDENSVQWKSYLSPTVDSPPPDPLNAILDLEIRTVLADRLLMKVDMATMSESLEARPPYLDHRVVEFAFQVPANYKIRFFKGKYLLRKAAEQLLPRSICWRRKHGFILPITKWAKPHLSDWVQSLWRDSSMDSINILNKAAIQKKLENNYNSKNGEPIAWLWPVIVLSGWVQSVKTR